MSALELRSCFILMAMDDWLESQNLKVKELFAYTETASSGTFGLQASGDEMRFIDYIHMYYRDIYIYTFT